MVNFAKLAGTTPAPQPESRIVDDSVQSEAAVMSAIRNEVAAADALDHRIESMPNPEVLETADEEDLRESLKLDRLVADDFPFDPSQIEFIDGIVNHLFPADGSPGGDGACGTGAAGTGKTTCTKKIVDRLMDSATFSAINMTTYFKAGEPTPEDDEELDESEKRVFVPSVAMVGFTGRSTQMIKKNFPRSWHQNIMTIHRLLAFMPVWEEKWDVVNNRMGKTMRFEPTYDANNLLPWDVVLVDEAGMVGLELWEQLRRAMKPGSKIIMIGDINQLPPVHGRSVFGFAMAKWPSFELTHIHRQQGSDNKIVDAAWNVLNGKAPESANNFQMVPLDGMAPVAARQLVKFLPAITNKGMYDPIRDTTITATNGEDGQRGRELGQKPLNQEFAIIFNKDNPRYIIDAGRERQKFAVGDKVMATRNDHEQGITNGMTGIIVDIQPNPMWAGDPNRFGTVEAVNRYLAEQGEDDEEIEVDMDDILASVAAQDAGREAGKEKKERGPASHIVTVQFGGGEHAFEIAFGTLAEVASLATAYVVTCHKMQGGESPVVVVVLHNAHKSMLNREWLYTAITRASEKCILLYTPLALNVALSKQRIVGRTLAQKIESFNALAREGILGPAVRVNLGWGGKDAIVDDKVESKPETTDVQADEPKASPSLPAIPRQMPQPAFKIPGVKEQPKPAPETVRVVERVIIVDRVAQPVPSPTVKDGGDLTPQPDWKEQERLRQRQEAERIANNFANQDRHIRAAAPKHWLPAPQVKLVSQYGAVEMLHKIEDAQAIPLLTHQPKPENKGKATLAMLLAKQRSQS